MSAQKKYEQQNLAEKSGTFLIGQDLKVNRLGFGTLHLTGKGGWGEPKDHFEALEVLHRAIDLGVNLIDTADSYGPEIAEKLITEALYPYPSDLVIATKGGFIRPGAGEWVVDGHPEHLRQACEQSLKRLKLDCIDLYQLHRIDPDVPLQDQIGTLVELQKEGKIRHVGVSNVTLEELKKIRRLTQIATVQNKYNLIERTSEDVLNYCEQEGIGFIPWFPLATGELANEVSPIMRIAKRLEATPAQVTLAWLLHKSPVMLPIPGTSSVKHLEENLSSVLIELTSSDLKELDQFAWSS